MLTTVASAPALSLRPVWFMGVNFAQEGADVNRHCSLQLQHLGSWTSRAATLLWVALTLNTLKSEFAQNSRGGVTRSAFYAQLDTNFGDFGAASPGPAASTPITSVV